jgi:hypothetical protein
MQNKLEQLKENLDGKTVSKDLSTNIKKKCENYSNPKLVPN